MTMEDKDTYQIRKDELPDLCLSPDQRDFTKPMTLINSGSQPFGTPSSFYEGSPLSYVSSEFGSQNLEQLYETATNLNLSSDDMLANENYLLMVVDNNQLYNHQYSPFDTIRDVLGLSYVLINQAKEIINKMSCSKIVKHRQEHVLFVCLSLIKIGIDKNILADAFCINVSDIDIFINANIFVDVKSDVKTDVFNQKNIKEKHKYSNLLFMLERYEVCFNKLSTHLAIELFIECNDFKKSIINQKSHQKGLDPNTVNDLYNILKILN